MKIRMAKFWNNTLLCLLRNLMEQTLLAVCQKKQRNILFDIFIALNFTVLTIDLIES